MPFSKVNAPSVYNVGASSPSTQRKSLTTSGGPAWRLEICWLGKHCWLNLPSPRGIPPRELGSKKKNELEKLPKNVKYAHNC